MGKDAAAEIVVGLVQIAELNWSHRKKERYYAEGGVIYAKGKNWAAPATSFVYLPYSVGLLQAYVQQYAPDPARYRFLSPIYKREPIPEAVAALRAADVVGFSTYVWNVRQSLAIARQLKEERPDRLIVFGGPEVPDHAEAFLRANPCVDIVCHGEGEKVFLQILEQAYGRDWQGIPSVSYLTPAGEYVRQPSMPRTKELSAFPSPYLTGIFDELMAHQPNQEWLAIWETNRGCPFSCTFCDWGSATASKVYRFDMERLQGEMEWFARNQIRFLFICDANFGIFERDITLIQQLVDAYEAHDAFVNISIQNAKNRTDRTYEIQKILTESRIATYGATIAMQGVAEQTLKAIKRQNISLEAFNELQRRFRRDGLETYTDLIVGLPGETYQSFAEGISSIIQGGQHNRMTSYNCSVLINAEMGNPDYQRLHGIEYVPLRIIYQHDTLTSTQGEDVHEYINTVIATHTMPRADWRRSRAFAWMTELLHFNRLLQVVMVVLVEGYGFTYQALLEMFLDVDEAEYPTLGMIARIFDEHAHAIQRGEPEFIPSERYLNIWWPADQYALIHLVTEGHLAAFYAEAERLLAAHCLARAPHVELPVLRDAIRLNHALFRIAECFTDLPLSLDHNIYEFYQGVLTGAEVPLAAQPSHYHIDRTSTVWLSWEAWCEDVVLQVYMRGNYFYPVHLALPVAAPSLSEESQVAS